MLISDIRALPRLAYPPARLQLEATPHVRVLDVLRRRWVAMTPEEWVRQHVVHWLVDVAGYSVHRMSNELGIKLNGTRRRCDTVVYNDTGRAAMIIEFKAPHIPLTQAVLEQALRYDMVLQTGYIVITNGIRTVVATLRRNADGTLAGADFSAQWPPYEAVRQAR